VTEWFHLQFIQRQFAIGEHRLENLLILLQDGITPQKLQYQLSNIKYFVFDLIKHPLIEFARGKDAGIFQIYKMTRGFGLRELQNVLQISNTHFTVGHDQVQDAKARSIAAREKNLRTKVDVEMLQPHEGKLQKN
jgi:hypothetical protein